MSMHTAAGLGRARQIEEEVQRGNCHGIWHVNTSWLQPCGTPPLNMDEDKEPRELVQSCKGRSDSCESNGSPGPDMDTKPLLDSSDEKTPLYARSKPLRYLHEHRKIIPGYGAIQLVMRARLYALYVLFLLLLAYLINQLDRYTLPIVTTTVGAELRYGDMSCQPEPNVTDSVLKHAGLPTNFTSICKTYKHNETLCYYESEFDYNDTVVSACRYWYDGSGITYQILAGPVFNSVYIVAGVIMGFLADFGNRKVFLVMSLVLWSLATGLTGFAQHYWHLVILRALLAIGAAGCSPFAVSIISDYFVPELRGTAVGFYYWGIYIGYSLAFAIGNTIVAGLGWRWVFFFSAIFGLVLAPFILFTVKEPERKKNVNVSTDANASVDRRQRRDRFMSLLTRLWMVLKTFLMPGMFVFCIAAGVRNAGGYNWAYNTEIFFEQFYSKGTISRFLGWIPLVGGSIGAIVGGLISDILVKNRGIPWRIWVLVVSQLLAAPFAAGALFLPYPVCFLSLIPSNVIGEMWIGAATAIVVDVSPVKLRTTVIAVYLFIITAIGGNVNFLVSIIKTRFAESLDDVTSYRWALFLMFPGLYVVSAFLFLLAFVLLRLDLKRKAKIEASINFVVDADDSEDHDQ